MAETAAFLVDQVLPRAPVRQWVLSLPIELRYRLAYDSQLTAAVLKLFVGAVFASLRRRARRQWGPSLYRCGGVTFVQRFGDALNLNVHFHSVLLDGVYVARERDGMRFRRLPAPDDTEVERVTRDIVRRLRRLLLRRGLTADADPSEADPLSADEPLLAEIYAASVRSRTAMAERAGRRLLRIGECIDPEEAAFVTGARCASIDGVSLHANVAVPARDRARLEKLCRYVARPPIATHRLSRLDDGRLLYRLKRRWRDGTTHVVFEPLELIEKLVAIIAPPRCHMIRYQGVLAPRARRRAEVVGQAGSDAAHTTSRHGSRSPSPATTPARCARGAHASPPGTRKHADSDGETGSDPRAREPLRCGRRWIPWAELMRRVFDIDVLECPGCGSRMLVLDVVLPPDATRELLDSLQLPARAPPLEPACYDFESP